MKKIKTTVDREPVSSDYIGSKQNFGHVLSQVKNLKPPIWKTAWFYGPVGLAVVAVTIAATSIDPTSELEQKKTTIAELTDFVSQKDATNHVAYHDDTKVISQKQDNSTSIPESRETSPVQEEVIEPVLDIEDEIVEINIVPEEIIETPNPKVENMLPNIEGVFTGDIFYGDLCSNEGITVNNDISVTSFTINYYSGKDDVLKKIYGNIIPTDVCEMIEKHNIGNMIFITDIRGVDMKGNRLSLTSLNYTATN